MKKSPRVICFVPSLTETLIECGIEIVGRTRFCIYPEEKVKNISIIGGTKDFKKAEILSLKSDLVVVDQEENKKELYDFLNENKIEVFVFHVTSLAALSKDLYRLADRLEWEAIRQLAKRAEANFKNIDINKFLKYAVLNWTENTAEKIRFAIAQGSCEYIIWKNPWMGIGKETFITDVMTLIGLQFRRPEKYPVLNDTHLRSAFCFFSTEPYPFASKLDELKDAGFNGCLIDGEKISWYGIRTIRFLESCVSTA